MKINGSVGNSPVQSNFKAVEKVKEDNIKKTETAVEEVKYIPSTNVSQKAAYEKPKVDHATIQKLKAESDRVYGNLRRMVEELLRRQGMTFRDIDSGAELEIDEITRTEAQALIGEGGELSPEKVSDRIVEFAKGISGGDKGKYDELKAAIDEGFKQAAAQLGGTLPDISQKTYDLVMQKLNQWLED